MRRSAFRFFAKGSAEARRKPDGASGEFLERPEQRIARIQRPEPHIADAPAADHTLAIELLERYLNGAR